MTKFNISDSVNNRTLSTKCQLFHIVELKMFMWLICIRSGRLQFECICYSVCFAFSSLNSKITACHPITLE